MRDFVAFVEFKRREKHTWRSFTFGNVVDFTKVNTLPWVFFAFLEL